QRGGVAVRELTEPDELDRLVRVAAADADVLAHGHRVEELDVLERARDAAPDDPVRRRAEEAPAGQAELAGVGPVEAGDNVEERRLAGAVRPDQPDDLVLARVERDTVEGDDAAEAPADVLDVEEGGHRPKYPKPCFSARWSSWASSLRFRPPPGRALARKTERAAS